MGRSRDLRGRNRGRRSGVCCGLRRPLRGFDIGRLPDGPFLGFPATAGRTAGERQKKQDSEGADKVTHVAVQSGGWTGADGAAPAVGFLILTSWTGFFALCGGASFGCATAGTAACGARPPGSRKRNQAVPSNSATAAATSQYQRFV